MAPAFIGPMLGFTRRGMFVLDVWATAAMDGSCGCLQLAEVGVARCAPRGYLVSRSGRTRLRCERFRVEPSSASVGGKVQQSDSFVEALMTLRYGDRRKKITVLDGLAIGPCSCLIWFKEKKGWWASSKEKGDSPRTDIKHNWFGIYLNWPLIKLK